MTHVQHRDEREHQAVRDGGEEEEPVRVVARPERGGGDVREARDRAPRRGFGRRLALDRLYGFLFPFSSYS